MKKRFVGLYLFIALSVCVSLLSCSTSYDKMINDFNKQNFSLEVTPPKEYSINDSTFNPELMLEKRYTLLKGFETTLIAPSGGAKYEWVIKIEDEEGCESEIVSTKRKYSFMPGTDIKTDIETNLVLTVTDDSGAEYIDTALLIVINRD